MNEKLIISSGIALYALFIALLMPAVRDFKNFVVASIGMGMNFLLKEVGVAAGVSIVIAMVGAALIGLILEVKDKHKGTVT
ncbi:hypothetical protein [Nosocomiicoccus ampullae]|uniref:hypothetical protein n=1 Tax=Nosocomiicoccus ampullae TaxID=489910 RepID=UPI001C5D7F2B|nr:hypothetical protein [Nosocomiicoccus ampullae]QYA47883.1 hypothetical protein KPF52_05355 [Nosocomiicoccus ampullae]